MDDFEKAIICLSDPTHFPETTTLSAQTYLQMVTQDTGRTWRLCLERIIKNTSRPEVLFWCFRTLTQLFSNEPLFQQLDRQSIGILQQNLLLYIGEIVAKDAQLAPYLKNKFCECIVALYRATYLGMWNDFWPSIFQLLSTSSTATSTNTGITSPTSPDTSSSIHKAHQQHHHQNKLLNSNAERVIDIYLGILEEIDNQVVSRVVDRGQAHHSHNIAIKDKMRDDCMVNIVKTWYTILDSRHKALTKRCLSTMKNYIDWIDINLIIGNEQQPFMKMIFSYVTVADFREEACDCLNVVRVVVVVVVVFESFLFFVFVLFFELF